MFAKTSLPVSCALAISAHATFLALLYGCLSTSLFDFFQTLNNLRFSFATLPPPHSTTKSLYASF
jgi:hypothetical protein